MDLKVSPDLVQLLESANPADYDRVLATILSDVEKEIKSRTQPPTRRELPTSTPKRPRFNRD